MWLHLHLDFFNSVQPFFLLLTRFVRASFAYISVALSVVFLYEVQDGLWLEGTDGGFVDGVIAEPVNFVLLINFI